MASMVGELFVALGFKVDQKALKDFDDGIKTLEKNMFKLAAGAAATVWALNRFVAGSVSRAEQLRAFRLETGWATDGIEQMAEAARQFDSTVTFDRALQGMKTLADLSGSAGWGQFEGKALFTGISDWANITPERMLSVMRENYGSFLAMQGGNVAAVQQILDTVGMGWAVGLLQADNASYNRAMTDAERFMTTPEQEYHLLRLADALSDVRANFGQWKKEITAKISPALVDMLEKSIPLLYQFSNAVEETAIAVSPHIKDLVENMAFLANAAWEGFAGLDGSMQAGILGFLVLLAARLHPVTASVTLLVAGLNELSKFMQGKESIIDPLEEFLNERGATLRGDGPTYLEMALEKTGQAVGNIINNYTDSKSVQYPPMPTPMQGSNFSNNINIYSNQPALEVGWQARQQTMDALWEFADRTGMVANGGQ